MSVKPTRNKSFGEKFADIFIPRKGDNNRQRSAKIVADIAAVLVVLALVVTGMIVNKYVFHGTSSQPSESTVSNSSEAVSSASADSGMDEEEPKNVYEPEEPVMNPALGVLDEFSDYYGANSDFVGYLRIDGTSLDTPVVKGKDNAYYLDRTLEKTKNAFGVPFADFRAEIAKDKQSDNVTIYGHSEKDGGLFGAVKEYDDIEYYKKHPYLTFDTIYGKAEYKIVGAFVARVYADASKKPDPEEFNYHVFVDAQGNGTEFQNYMDEVYKRSFWTNPDVDVMFGDQLVTLSTCDSEIHAFGAPTEYRRVLVARKIRTGEVVDVDVSKAETNKDMVMPKAWQQKFGKENPYQ